MAIVLKTKYWKDFLTKKTRIDNFTVDSSKSNILVIGFVDDLTKKEVENLVGKENYGIHWVFSEKMSLDLIVRTAWLLIDRISPKKIIIVDPNETSIEFVDSGKSIHLTPDSVWPVDWPEHFTDEQMAYTKEKNLVFLKLITSNRNIGLSVIPEKFLSTDCLVKEITNAV